MDDQNVSFSETMKRMTTGINKACEDLGVTMSRATEGLAGASEMLRKTSLRFNIGADFAKLFEMPPELKAELKKAGVIEKLSVKCIKNNWVFPYIMPTEKKIEICDSAEKLNNVDAILFEFYSSSGLKQLMDESFSASDYFCSHQAKIDQTVSAYYSGYYYPCLAALCSILEGMIAQFAEDPNQFRSNDLKLTVRTKFGHLSPGHYAQDYFLWKSILEFLEKFYSYSPFAGVEPEHINRNWILHGRTKNHASQLDCIKLFSAILGVNKMLLLYIEDQEDSNAQ